MATSDLNYATVADIAITSLDSLADGAWASSALVDNQTNEYIDAHVGGSIKLGTIGSDGGTIDIYVVGSWDGTDFGAGADNGDGGITWGTTGNTHAGGEFDLRKLGVIQVVDADDNQEVRFGPYGIAQHFGGFLPREWAIIFENNTGAALNADAGATNHLEYTGIKVNTA